MNSSARSLALVLTLFLCPASQGFSAEPPAASPPDARQGDENDARRREPRLEVLSDQRWKDIDASVGKALAWLSTQQAPDGSFATKPSGQPGVTSLCVMAYLSSGHSPGQGPYGERLERAIDFVLSCQREDGLFSLEDTVLPADAWTEASHTATYNHAISGLMLGEVYGQTDGTRAKKIQPAIERGLDYTRRMQHRRKRSPIDEWAWRYVKDVPISSGDGGGDADMSVTAWHIMFLRSARNAGFDVPVANVNEALDFVRRCYQPETGTFSYALYANGREPTRATTGAGVLSLFLAGRYDPQIANRAGSWILAHPFAELQRIAAFDGPIFLCGVLLQPGGLSTGRAVLGGILSAAGRSAAGQPKWRRRVGRGGPGPGIRQRLLDGACGAVPDATVSTVADLSALSRKRWRDRRSRHCAR